ncbi:MAG: VapC toxin family PIN domain ribonuclease [Sphingobium sp.]|nr:VapC toxin family PIN domain ribonuclease [Sphingobium sp.]
MKIIADTNILVRAITDDDDVQSPLAQAQLDQAEIVAITLPTLCELAWVLTRTYKVRRAELATLVRILCAADNVKVEQASVEAGLAFLDAGGDFADGVIIHEGNWLGGRTFVSFDADAVRLAQAQGQAARIPA